jgi:hypothetical protein
MSVKLQLLGDVSLDGLYCCPQNHQAFSDNCAMVRELLGECDYRVANWEAPICGNGEFNTAKKIRLATTWEAAESLLPLGITIATLANNHTFDCGTSGFLRTCEFFAKNAIKHLGAANTAEEAGRPLLFEKNGISFALLNYASTESCPPLPSGCDVHFNFFPDEAHVLNEIRTWKSQVDHVLVGLHWGHRDHLECPPPQMRKFGRSMIESGASLVFGGQFHILQGYEMWRKGCIMYALGNYCFSPVGMSCGDAFWISHPLTRKVGIASVEFDKTGIAAVAWHYLQQPQNSLLLVEDQAPQRRRRHLSRIGELKKSDRAYRRLYQLNVFKWDIIDYISMYGGVWKALTRLRFKHLRKILGWIGGQSLRPSRNSE